MNHLDPDASEVITLPEAARLLGVGPTTLKRWSDQGRIPHTRTPGGHRRFLRSVIMDFRALVDPRAGMGRSTGHLSLRLGSPAEWLDRANTLADPDRMEAALLALRANAADWGQAADSVLDEFILGLRRRHAEGRLSEGAWRALRSSFVRATLRAAGRVRPRTGAPVAFVAAIGGITSEPMLALAETVLRERGFTVLQCGDVADADLLARVIEDQQPHLVVLLSDRTADATALAARTHTLAGASAAGGAELWLAGSGAWPHIDRTEVLPTLSELGRKAARRAHGGHSFRPLGEAATV